MTNSSPRFGTRKYIISIDGKQYETYFTPVALIEPVNGINMNFENRDEYKSWLSEKGLTSEEMCASMVDPQLSKDGELGSYFRRLLIPHFGNVVKEQNKKPVICTHICTKCNEYFSLYFTKCGSFRTSNARTHLLHTHKKTTTSKRKLRFESTESIETVDETNSIVSLDHIHTSLVRFLVQEGLSPQIAKHPRLTELLTVTTQLEPGSYCEPTENDVNNLRNRLYHTFVEKVRDLLVRIRIYQTEHDLDQGVCTLVEHHDQHKHSYVSLCAVDPHTSQGQQLVLGRFDTVLNNVHQYQTRVERVLALYGLVADDFGYAISNARSSVPRYFNTTSNPNLSEICEIRTISNIVFGALQTRWVTSLNGRNSGWEVVESMRIWVLQITSCATSLQQFNEIAHDDHITSLRFSEITEVQQVFELFHFFVIYYHHLVAFLDQYDKYENQLKREDFQLIGGLECIIRPFSVFYQQLQTSTSTSISIARKVLLRMSLESDVKTVVDFNASQWHSDLKIEELPMKAWYLRTSSGGRHLQVPEPIIYVHEALQNGFNGQFCKPLPNEQGYILWPSDTELLAMMVDPAVMVFSRTFMCNLTFGEDLPLLWQKAKQLLHDYMQVPTNHAVQEIMWPPQRDFTKLNKKIQELVDIGIVSTKEIFLRLAKSTNMTVQSQDSNLQDDIRRLEYEAWCRLDCGDIMNTSTGGQHSKIPKYSLNVFDIEKHVPWSIWYSRESHREKFPKVWNVGRSLLVKPQAVNIPLLNQLSRNQEEIDLIVFLNRES